MADVATPRNALVTGIVTGIVMYFFGPYVDRSEGAVGTVLMLACVAVVAVPAYFLVFGLSKEQLVGFWVANPALLKRIGAWLLGVASVSAIFSLLHLVK